MANCCHGMKRDMSWCWSLLSTASMSSHRCNLHLYNSGYLCMHPKWACWVLNLASLDPSDVISFRQQVTKSYVVVVSITSWHPWHLLLFVVGWDALFRYMWSNFLWSSDVHLWRGTLILGFWLFFLLFRGEFPIAESLVFGVTFVIVLFVYYAILGFGEFPWVILHMLSDSFLCISSDSVSVWLSINLVHVWLC